MQNEEPIADVPHPRDLFLAIRHWDADEVARLLERGANPNWKNRRGDETALAYAALVSTADVVRVLLAYGATDNGKMPLYEAVSWDRSDGNPDSAAIARLLLKHNPNAINDTDEHGVTPLMTAVEAGDVATTRVYLDCGADVHAEYAPGKTALFIALSLGHHEIAEILRSTGAR